MEDSEEIIYTESNFGIEKVKNSHSVVIYKNFRYWWSKENKDTSARYVCSEKECYASIRIKDNKVTKLGGKHYHDPITIGEIALLRASQDLKKEVTKDVSKSIQSCYQQTQMRLIQAKIPERTIAAKFNSTESVLPMQIQPILQLENVTYANLETVTGLPELDLITQNQRQVMPTTSIRSTPSIAIHEINLDNLQDDRFNYVRSLINQDVLSEISNTRKAEEDRKNQLTEQYNAAITQDDIESEVKRLWTKSKDKENRKRISKKDREAAVLSLTRQIKEKVKIQLASEFLEKHGVQPFN